MKSGLIGLSKKIIKKVLGLNKNPQQILIPTAERIKQYEDYMEVGRKVLEVGTGSGILAEMALAKGCDEIVAIDINPHAVKAASKRVPEATVILSDLFEQVSGTFDTIIFAAPWSEGEVRRPYDHALFDCGVSERFFKEVKQYLNPDGTIWFQYCDAFPEKYNRLDGLFSNNGLIVEQQWSYQDWGNLVQREVNVFLYRIKQERIS